MTHQNSPLLTRKQAAEYLGVGEGTLHNWACTKRYNLKFYKVGKLARYKLEDLDAFIESRAKGLID